MAKNTSILSSDEYYLWKRRSKIQYPWERQYISWDFLSYEKKRIEDLSDWYSAFKKVDYQQEKYDLILYAVPIELSSTWKATVAEHNMNYMGLSALPNSPQNLLVGLFPEGVNAPHEYAPIRITGARRILLQNIKKKMLEYALIIESWEPIESDFIYKDVPYEKNIISKILQENLINDVSVTRAFQSPAMSSPYVPGSFGGISLSSFSSDASFCSELIKSINLMVPPEYRTTSPPQDALVGIKFHYTNGIKFHFAERPYVEDNILSGFKSREYATLTHELSRRLNFKGEYSIFSSIIPTKAGHTQLMMEFVLKFPQTEITFPKSVEESILTGSKVDDFNHAINEDIWIQVVHARQLHPGLDNRSSRYLAEYAGRLSLDYDAILSSVYSSSTIRSQVVSSMFHQSKYNLERLAQSLARADGKKTLAEKQFQLARGIIIDNFSELVHKSDIKQIISRMKARKENERFSVIQSEIINNPKSTTLELYNELKSLNLFDDIYDLQTLLDWLRKKGHVVEDEKKRYTWVVYLSSN